MMIDVKNLQIKYDDFIAINDINFSVNEGEFFTLLGPSGCGKSTTLRAIAGFLTPSEGTITVNNQDITNVSVEKRGLGMVFQSYALFPTMTVYDNIAYGLKVDKMPKVSMDKRINELANLVELKPEQLKRNVSDLSGGQQQRVAIARALAKKPSIVLFDEPLSNLDAKLRKQLRNELKQIQRDTGMTAIYVTHDQEEALEMSDKIAVFNNGKIDQIGTPEEIYNHSATEFVCNFIGDANLLDRSFIELINVQLTTPFDINKRHYLREEKVKLISNRPNDSHLAFEATVERVLFYGTSSTLVLRVKETLLTTLVKNDGQLTLHEGEKVTVYLNPSDILEYEVTQ